MFGIGFTELVVILIVALIFIGPDKLPDIAKAFGRAFMEFKKATDDLKKQVTDLDSTVSGAAGEFKRSEPSKGDIHPQKTHLEDDRPAGAEGRTDHRHNEKNTDRA